MDNHSEEIDLLYLINKVNKLIRRCILGVFQALGFIRKYWIVILIVVAAGVGYGYYQQSKIKPPQHARVLLKVNFDAVNYVYSMVGNINETIADKNFDAFGDEAIAREMRRVGALEITPIINLKDIIDEFEMNDRNLEGILRTLEFEFEEDSEITQISETFTSEYKYHFLNFTVSSEASPETIQAVLDYINSNPVLQEIKAASIASLEEQINVNVETRKQIDNVLKSYEDSGSGASADGQVYLMDKFLDISQVFKSKAELQRDLRKLRKEMAYASEVVVNVNQPNLFVENPKFLGNPMLRNALIFLGVFFLLALLRAAYFSLKRIADAEAAEQAA